MSINEMVLHQGPDPLSSNRLDVAIEMAKRHKAHISAVYTLHEVSILGGLAELFGTKTWSHATAQEAAKKSEQIFWRRMSDEGVEGGWETVDGRAAKVLGERTRCADLMILSQTDPDDNHYETKLPDEVILSSSAPVLIVPYANRSHRPEDHAMIAWDGSREAARAVRDAMPVLRRAKTITIQSINPRSNKGRSARDLGAFLALHGIKAKTSHSTLIAEADAVSSSLKTVGGFGFQEMGSSKMSRRAEIGRPDVGNALLSAVTDAGADLLVMGAYGYSRYRELILGGVTREVLRSMTVPVLMSN